MVARTENGFEKQFESSQDWAGGTLEVRDSFIWGMSRFKFVRVILADCFLRLIRPPQYPRSSLRF